MEIEPLFIIDLPPAVPPMEIIVMDLTPFYFMKQTKAAALLHMPVSTLSKHWTKAGGGRLWPYRKLQQIDAKLQLKTIGKAEMLKLQRQRAKILAPTTIQVLNRNVNLNE
jgi:hypothetical protein